MHSPRGGLGHPGAGEPRSTRGSGDSSGDDTPLAQALRGQFVRKAAANPLKAATEIFLPVNSIFKNLCLVWEFKEILLAEDAEVQRGAGR